MIRASFPFFPCFPCLPFLFLLVYREAAQEGVDPTGRIVRQAGAADALVWSDPETLRGAIYDFELVDAG